MLGLILLYFIGKSFYDLGVKHEQNAWLCGVLGIVFYYLGAFLVGIALALAYEFAGWGTIDELSDRELGLLAMPFGLLSAFLGYRFLDSHYSGKKDLSESDILDQGFNDD